MIGQEGLFPFCLCADRVPRRGRIPSAACEKYTEQISFCSVYF